MSFNSFCSPDPATTGLPHPASLLVARGGLRQARRRNGWYTERGSASRICGMPPRALHSANGHNQCALRRTVALAEGAAGDHLPAFAIAEARAHRDSMVLRLRIARSGELVLRRRQAPPDGVRLQRLHRFFQSERRPGPRHHQGRRGGRV